MIVKEFYKTRQDGIMLFRTYSDNGFCIIQKETGILYDEAIDVVSANYSYEESDIMIERNESGIE